MPSSLSAVIQLLDNRVSNISVNDCWLVTKVHSSFSVNRMTRRQSPPAKTAGNDRNPRPRMTDGTNYSPALQPQILAGTKEIDMLASR